MPDPALRLISLHQWPRGLQWLALALSAATAGQILFQLNVPAGRFLGAMLVAIAFGVTGSTLRMPRMAFKTGQGLIGLLVAHAITADVLLSVAQSWQMMLLATVLTVGMSAVVSLLMVRFSNIGGSTAAWGTTPGAASAMVAMAEANGADPRVVATMQYVRVVCVVMLGALVSHLIGVEGGGAERHATTLIDANLLHMGLTLATLALGLLLGAKLPAGALLGPLLLGAALQLGGWLHIALPTPLLTLAYACIGCYVGLRFDRKTIRYVLRRLPAMVLGALVLILLCALSAWGLALATGKDFLSLYLATSPGGLDTMAIIAVDTHADVGLVLAMQTLRLLGVILCGAFIARQVIRLTESHRQRNESATA